MILIQIGCKKLRWT